MSFYHHRLRSNVGRNMLQIQQIWLRISPISVVLCSYGSYGPCLSMIHKDLLIAALGCCRNLRKLYLLQRRSSSVFDWTLWFELKRDMSPSCGKPNMESKNGWFFAAFKRNMICGVVSLPMDLTWWKSQQTFASISRRNFQFQRLQRSVMICDLTCDNRY